MPTPTLFISDPANRVAVPTVVDAVRVVAPVTPSVVENVPDVPESAPTRVSAPAELKDEVAVEPKEAFVSAENQVVDALVSVVEPVTPSVEVKEAVVPVSPAMRASAPPALNVEVAVPPKYEIPVAENIVVDA